MIILIASVSVLISYFVVSAIPGLKVSDQKTTVKTIDRYESEVGDLTKPYLTKMQLIQLWRSPSVAVSRSPLWHF